MSKPVCLVTGVGPEGGTGAETARRFGEGGYRVAMLARNADNLDALAGKYEDARAYPCDVADLDALVETVSRIRAEMGAPSVVVHNALRSARGGILELDPDDLEKNFRVNTTALLYLARETIPAMLEAGKGAILMTGNTSATRGGKNYGFFASTKAAQRILAESIAREFGPQGIHVAYFIIDAAIETPRTREVLAPGNRGGAVPRRPPGPLAWSFRVELRPFGGDLVRRPAAGRATLRRQRPSATARNPAFKGLPIGTDSTGRRAGTPAVTALSSSAASAARASRSRTVSLVSKPVPRRA